MSKYRCFLHITGAAATIPKKYVWLAMIISSRMAMFVRTTRGSHEASIM